MKPDNTLLRKFHTLVRQAGALANKEDILDGLGVSSAKDLSKQQLEDLCNELQKLSQARTDAPKEIRAARSRILTLCTDLGVLQGNNWARLNEYLMNPKIAGKLLYMMDLQELKALNKKLSVILRAHLEAKEKAQHQAINN